MGALRQMRIFNPPEKRPLPPLKLTGKFKEGDTAEVVGGKHAGKRVTVRFTSNGIVFVMERAFNFHVREEELKWLTSLRR